MTPTERFRDLVLSAPTLGETILTGAFLNHRVDVQLLTETARELAPGLPPCDLVLTTETGGIAPAFAVAQALGRPMVIARRTPGRVPGDVLQVQADEHHLVVAREVLPVGTNVLLVDDILGHGRTEIALARLCEHAGARVVGAVVFVEKTFQGGRSRLETLGLRVTSVVRIADRGGSLIPERRGE
ncbi:MAG TPA: phosphoribosyltransferase family protein [Deinococcales bacterium]|nr:phosphoribosyltransferase family protein [Deinococcales bacterium]